MMKIRKAVITAAARGERLYPVADTIQKAMLPVIDTDGLHKPVLQIICEEAFASGIEEICVVCAPGDGERYVNAFTSLRDNLVRSFKGVGWALEEAEKVDHLVSHLRLLEGLAQPREEDELALSYYNSMTTWISVDGLLQLFGLSRQDLMKADEAQLAQAVRSVAQRIPSYVTIKDVKYRWGHGQEGIYPVAQIEKLWSDMSALPDVPCGYIAVPRLRGQQMKDPAQLDAWLTDGSKDFVASLCSFS